MGSTNEIRIEQRTLDAAVIEGSRYISTSYIEGVINKCEQREQLGEAFSRFFGTYKAMKSTLRGAEVCSEISFYNREALLDCYSTFIAAAESIQDLESKGITKKRDTKSLLGKDIDFRKFEKDTLLREKLVLREFTNGYMHAAEDLNSRMISDYTINYFEWLQFQCVRIKNSISLSSILDEEIKARKIVLPGRNGKGKTYEGMIYVERKIAKKIDVQGKPGIAVEEPQEEQEYMYLERNLPDITFDDVGGLEEHKEQIRRVIRLPIEKKDKIKELRVIEPPKGIIFYGGTGTGKTYIAKAIANEEKLPFFYVSGPNFMKKFVGEGPRTVRQLFADARTLAPSIIFIDEANACYSDRESEFGKYSGDIVDQTLTEVDGFKPLDSVKLILATNFYERLDKTLIGRIPQQYHLEFPYPDEEARYKALSAITRKMKTNGIDIESLASISEGANFRALFQICNEAGLYAAEDDADFIGQKHIDKAFMDYIKKPKIYNAG